MNNSAKSYLFRKNISLSFFKFLERKKIDYSYLGNTFNFPQKIKTDVDMYVDFKNIEPKKSGFLNLTFKNQKRFLIEVLDKNMMYLPLSEISDADYSISKKDKLLNKKFYS